MNENKNLGLIQHGLSFLKNSYSAHRPHHTSFPKLQAQLYAVGTYERSPTTVNFIYYYEATKSQIFGNEISATTENLSFQFFPVFRF
jgi:hypothetical protein